VTAVLQGVRILEVAEHTFVPPASAGVPHRRRHAVQAGLRAGAVRRATGARPTRPELNEHGDDILGELGLDMDEIVEPRGPRRRRVTDLQSDRSII
jgi:hypothetical protein